MEKKLSIIIPVYNVAQYLDDCFQSVLKQKVDSFEVIVVNDGSTDYSQEIIDRYVKDYPNIFRALQKENGGLSDARNFGVPHATGEYIAFLDSDDYVAENTYIRMIEKASEIDADIVLGDIIYFWEEEERTLLLSGLNQNKIDGIQKKAMLSPLFAWNKLFKKSFYLEHQFCFPLNTWYEDIEVILRAFSLTDRIAYTPEGKFYYRQRSGSIMANKNSERLFEIFSVLERVYNDFETRNEMKEFKSVIEYLFIEHILLYGQFRFFRSSLWKSLCTHGFSFVQTYFPEWRKNEYMRLIGMKNKVFILTNNGLTMYFYHFILNK